MVDTSGVKAAYKLVEVVRREGLCVDLNNS